MIVHNIKEGEYVEDKEILEKLKEIEKMDDLYNKYLQKVKYCTEDYKAWSYLKQKLNIDNKDEQLKCTVSSIGFNPKSYESWFHRLYILKKFRYKIEEKDLLNILIKADKRNLHCWNYINNLYGDFTFIPKDVTNYTYLHYANGFDPISCIFTDCYDQGMWFYYFTCQEKDLLKDEFYVRCYKNEMAIIFKNFFQGVINDTVINIPVKYINISVSDELNINGINYKLELYSKHTDNFNDIKDIDKDCIFNYIFNLDVKWKYNITDNVWSNYLNNVEDDKYKIYVIKK